MRESFRPMTKEEYEGVKRNNVVPVEAPNWALDLLYGYCHSREPEIKLAWVKGDPTEEGVDMDLTGDNVTDFFAYPESFKVRVSNTEEA